MKRQALGRGLSALLSEEYREAKDVLTDVDIEALSPNVRQPRTRFEEAALDELARSIQANGVLQPILVRRDGHKLEIIAGERRWRAARKAGLKRIPAIVRDLPAQKSLELALIENLQREALNPIEEAKAYEWLIQDYGLSQEEVAVRVGKERSSVTNTIRLLKLPGDVQKLVVESKISMGHARALLALSSEADMRRMAERSMKESLSVRQVEELVRSPAVPAAGGPGATAGKKSKEAKDVHDRAAERKLEQRLGTRVVIRRSRRGGRIEVAFYSEEELQRLFEVLTERE
jgi:ParB family chromosome partitioning protein